MNRHSEAVSVSVGKHGILFCQEVLWPEEENIKLYLCLKRKRPQNLVVLRKLYQYLRIVIQKLYQCPLGSTGSSFLAGGRRYKIVSLSMKTRPQNLVVYGSCISVYKSSYRSCISVRWEARGPLLPGSSLAGWREYKIVSLSEEKKATELTVVLQKLHQCL